MLAIGYGSLARSCLNTTIKTVSRLWDALVFRIARSVADFQGHH